MQSRQARPRGSPAWDGVGPVVVPNFSRTFVKNLLRQRQNAQHPDLKTDTYYVLEDDVIPGVSAVAVCGGNQKDRCSLMSIALDMARDGPTAGKV